MLTTLTKIIKGGRFYIAVLASALLIYLVLALGSAYTIRPHQDEGWIANPALNLSTRGFMGTTVLEESSGFGMKSPGKPMALPGLNRYTYYLTPLELLALAAWFKVFTFGLVSMRVFSIVWGLIALAALFLIMKTLSGNRYVALLTFVLVALDVHFIMRAAHGRMDMMSAALAFASFALYLNMRQRNLSLAVLLSQSLTVASGLTHPNGGIVAFAGLLFLTIYFDRQRIKLKHVAIAVIPYIVGGVGWGLYIVKDSSAFWAQFTFNATSSGRLDAILHPMQALASEITDRYLINYGIASQPEGRTALAMVLGLVLVVYVIALVNSFLSRRIRQHKGYRALLFLTTIIFVILTLFEGMKYLWYLIYITPFLNAVVAVWLYESWQNRSLPRWVVALTLCGLLGLQITATAYRIKQNTYQNRFLPVADFIQSRGHKDPSVIGSSEFGFNLGFDNLMDDVWLGYFSGKRPDYIIINDRYQFGISDMIARDPAFNRHVSQLLGQEYELIAEPTPSSKVYQRR